MMLYATDIIGYYYALGSKQGVIHLENSHDPSLYPLQRDHTMSLTSLTACCVGYILLCEILC